MSQYEKALQDADVAISLAPDWPKGYFRRGRALAGLKVFLIVINCGSNVILLNLWLVRNFTFTMVLIDFSACGCQL